jgi:alpha-tubulin suppressor-like RCC1 family protein
MSALSTSGFHTCGISAGTVLCWGSDAAGELGDNSRLSRSTPVPINSSLSFSAVSAGTAHTCAVATTGEIYCWGFSDSGRLGDGTGFNGLGPIKVAGSVTFTAVSAGDSHTCAIATSGDAYCWGRNDRGQLGIGTFIGASTPTLVGGGLKFTAIAVGFQHTCGIAGGTVYCWGDNILGEIGDGTAANNRTAPTAVKSTAAFVTLAAGGANTCAIRSDGGAYCWGDNTTGQIGDPNFSAALSNQPIAVPGLTFKSIAVGGSGTVQDYYYGTSGSGHVCGITTGGVTYCWGSDSQGELGIFSVGISNATPSKVSGQQ